MARFDPFSLKRPAEPEETRTFTENGGELTLTLRKTKDFTRKLLSSDKASLYKKQYVTGEEVTDDGIARLEISTARAIDGRIPAISAALCNVIALLESMQVPVNGEEPITFQEWAATAVVMPETMTKITIWAGELSGDIDTNLKNDSGEAAAP